MSTRMRKAELRQERREREISRHFKNVNLCPKRGACRRYVSTREGGRYVCPTCDKEPRRT